MKGFHWKYNMAYHQARHGSVKDEEDSENEEDESGEDSENEEDYASPV